MGKKSNLSAKQLALFNSLFEGMDEIPVQVELEKGKVAAVTIPKELYDRIVSSLGVWVCLAKILGQSFFTKL